MSLARGARLTVALCGAGCLVLASGSPALATPVTSGTKAYSAPGSFGTASLHSTLSLSGSIGGLIGALVGPIVANALNPLVSALQGTLNTSLAAAIGATSPYSAGTPTTQALPKPAAFPGDLPGGLPSPCSTTSTTKPCYSATSGAANVTLPGIGTVGVTAMSGYTQQVDNSADSTIPIFGRAQVASTSVGILPALAAIPSPLVSVGTANSKANCPNSGATAPTAVVSATQVQALGGQVVVNVASTGTISSVVVGGTSYSIDSLPTTTVAGFSLSKFSASSLKLSVPLTITQVVAALGLSGSAVDDLLSSALPNQTLTLAVIIGSTVTTTATSAQAWGLGIGVDLSGSLGFDLLGLVGATVTVPTGIGGGNYGNVLDARLGYTSCSTGTTTSTTAVVPATLI